MGFNRNLTSMQEVRYSLEESNTSWVEIAVYLIAMTVLTALLLWLSVWVRANPATVLDVRGVETISGWEFAGASVFFNAIAFLTDNYPAFVIGTVSVVFVLVTGRNRIAMGLLVSGVFVGVAAFVGDYVLGEFVGRLRPDGGRASFPSGHALGDDRVLRLCHLPGLTVPATPQVVDSIDPDKYFPYQHGRCVSDLSVRPLAD